MSEAPRLRIEPLAADRWRITNEGPAIRLLETWLPHGRFRGAARRHDLALATGESTTLELPVAASGGPGDRVENAFLILRLEGWRVLARLLIRFDGAAAAHPEVVVVTSQLSGFSRVED
jgi:hypothetical protein